MARELVTRKAALRLVEQLLESGSIPVFIDGVCWEAFRFSFYSERNRLLFVKFLVKELERTRALEVRRRKK